MSPLSLLSLVLAALSVVAGATEDADVESHIPRCSGRCVDTWDKCSGTGGTPVKGVLPCCSRHDQCLMKNQYYSQCRPRSRPVPDGWDGSILRCRRHMEDEEVEPVTEEVEEIEEDIINLEHEVTNVGQPNIIRTLNNGQWIECKFNSVSLGPNSSTLRTCACPSGKSVISVGCRASDSRVLLRSNSFGLPNEDNTNNARCQFRNTHTAAVTSTLDVNIYCVQ